MPKVKAAVSAIPFQAELKTLLADIDRLTASLNGRVNSTEIHSICQNIKSINTQFSELFSHVPESQDSDQWHAFLTALTKLNVTYEDIISSSQQRIDSVLIQQDLSTHALMWGDLSSLLHQSIREISANKAKAYWLLPLNAENLNTIFNFLDYILNQDTLTQVSQNSELLLELDKFVHRFSTSLDNGKIDEYLQSIQDLLDFENNHEKVRVAHKRLYEFYFSRLIPLKIRLDRFNQDALPFAGKFLQLLDKMGGDIDELLQKSGDYLKSPATMANSATVTPLVTNPIYNLAELEEYISALLKTASGNTLEQQIDYAKSCSDILPSMTRLFAQFEKYSSKSADAQQQFIFHTKLERLQSLYSSLTKQYDNVMVDITHTAKNSQQAAQAREALKPTQISWLAVRAQREKTLSSDKYANKLADLQSASQSALVAMKNARDNHTLNSGNIIFHFESLKKLELQYQDILQCTQFGDMAVTNEYDAIQSFGSFNQPSAAELAITDSYNNQISQTLTLLRHELTYLKNMNHSASPKLIIEAWRTMPLSNFDTSHLPREEADAIKQLKSCLIEHHGEKLMLDLSSIAQTMQFKDLQKRLVQIADESNDTEITALASVVAELGGYRFLHTEINDIINLLDGMLHPTLDAYTELAALPDFKSNFLHQLSDKNRQTVATAFALVEELNAISKNLSKALTAFLGRPIDLTDPDAFNHLEMICHDQLARFYEVSTRATLHFQKFSQLGKSHPDSQVFIEYIQSHPELPAQQTLLNATSQSGLQDVLIKTMQTPPRLGLFDLLSKPEKITGLSKQHQQTLHQVSSFISTNADVLNTRVRLTQLTNVIEAVGMAKSKTSLASLAGSDNNTKDIINTYRLGDLTVASFAQKQQPEYSDSELYILEKYALLKKQVLDLLQKAAPTEHYTQQLHDVIHVIDSVRDSIQFFARANQALLQRLENNPEDTVNIRSSIDAFVIARDDFYVSLSHQHQTIMQEQLPHLQRTARYKEAKSTQGFHSRLAYIDNREVRSFFASHPALFATLSSHEVHAFNKVYQTPEAIVNFFEDKQHLLGNHLEKFLRRVVYCQQQTALIHQLQNEHLKMHLLYAAGEPVLDGFNAENVRYLNDEAKYISQQELTAMGISITADQLREINKEQKELAQIKSFQKADTSHVVKPTQDISANFSQLHQLQRAISQHREFVLARADVTPENKSTTFWQRVLSSLAQKLGFHKPEPKQLPSKAECLQTHIALKSQLGLMYSQIEQSSEQSPLLAQTKSLFGELLSVEKYVKSFANQSKTDAALLSGNQYQMEQSKRINYELVLSQGMQKAPLLIGHCENGQLPDQARQYLQEAAARMATGKHVKLFISGDNPDLKAQASALAEELKLQAGQSGLLERFQAPEAQAQQQDHLEASRAAPAA